MTSLALLRGTGGGKYADPFPADSDPFNDPATVALWNESAGDPTTLFWDINTTVPFAAYLQGQRYRVAPATPFRYLYKVVSVDWTRVAGVPQIGGVWLNLAQAAPGPYIGFGTDVGTPGEMHLGSSLFNGSGAFVSNPHVVGTVNDDSYAVGYVGDLFVHSATSVDYRISFDDGLTWTTICTGYNPGVTPNFVGMESGGAKSAYGWVKRIS